MATRWTIKLVALALLTLLPGTAAAQPRVLPSVTGSPNRFDPRPAIPQMVLPQWPQQPPAQGPQQPPVQRAQQPQPAQVAYGVRINCPKSQEILLDETQAENIANYLNQVRFDAQAFQERRTVQGVNGPVSRIVTGVRYSLQGGTTRILCESLAEARQIENNLKGLPGVTANAVIVR